MWDTKAKRPEKEKVYENLFQDENTANNALILPSVTMRDYLQGCENGVFNSQTKFLVYESNGEFFPTVRKRFNHKNNVIVKNNIFLDIHGIRNFYLKNGIIDFAHIDACGYLTPHAVLWVLNNSMFFNGKICFTLATNGRVNSEFENIIMEDSVASSAIRRMGRKFGGIHWTEKYNERGIMYLALVCKLLGVKPDKAISYMEYQDTKIPMCFFKIDVSERDFNHDLETKAIVAKAGRFLHKVKPSEWAHHSDNPFNMKKDSVYHENMELFNNPVRNSDKVKVIYDNGVTVKRGLRGEAKGKVIRPFNIKPQVWAWHPDNPNSIRNRKGV